MQQHFHFSLKDYNSFGFDTSCNRICFVDNEEDLQKLLPIDDPVFVLGGGSNVLFVKDIERLVIKPALTKIEIIEETPDWLVVQVGAGKNWHEFVKWCIENDYGGVENLSLIPGTVGAAPIQNIGAYGVELEQVFVGLHAYRLSSGTKEYFTKEVCGFGYRDSVFKQSLKGRYIITGVQFKLTKRNHNLEYSYKPLSNFLDNAGITEPGVKDISEAVIAIRQSKLPDPVDIGNAGSFFKNPIIGATVYDELKKQYPTMPSYPVNDDSVKVPAAWLIDQLGWKGYTSNDIGVHKEHALVLVNYGDGKATDIVKLSKTIMESVKEKFNIQLEREVQLIL